jgi:5-formyltetrahydrofolate cyclo-ligase
MPRHESDRERIDFDALRQLYIWSITFFLYFFTKYCIKSVMQQQQPCDKETSCVKAALRAEIRARRQALTARERQTLSHAAATLVLQSLPWKKARSVALYIAVRGEMDTGPLLQAAWQSGKQVLLPQCVMEGPVTMRFMPCPGPEMLAPGAFGIPEPCYNAEMPEAVPDLVIVPAVAFDRKGTRLGQGGGFYDRYFFRSEVAGVLRLGYIYAFQLEDILPRDPWDMPVDAVCTEHGILWTANLELSPSISLLK